MKKGIELLENFGLTKYQSKTFVALLTRGEATAKELSEMSTVPITKIYAILKSLESLGYLKCSLSRPKKYRPISIKLLVDSIIIGKKRSIEEIIKQKENAISILSELYDKGEKRDENQENLVWMLSGIDSGLEAVANLFSKAKKNIYLIATSEDWKMSYLKPITGRPWGEATLIRGVRCKMIQPSLNLKDVYSTLKLTFSVLGTKKKRKRITFFSKPHIEIRKLPQEKINFTMGIGDNKSLIIGLKHPFRGYSNAGLLIYDKNIIKGFSDYFLSLWNSAKPVSPVYKKTFINIVKRIITHY